MYRAIRLSFMTWLAVVTLSYAPTAGASEEVGHECRCILTFSSGPSHESYCDGFDPATHRTCSCEKATGAAGSPRCVPKGQKPLDSSASETGRRRTSPKN